MRIASIARLLGRRRRAARRFTALGLAAAATSLLVACGPEMTGPGQGAAVDNDPPLADYDELLAGAPNPNDLPREYKADEILPASYSDLVALQSPVKSQGSRGVCSIFSTVGLMEHLYIAAHALPQTPDFSEQYLQWEVKTQLGAFPGSSGSTAATNLRAIDQIGIPMEDAWPYESFQWGASQDPACDPGTGDGESGLPVRCYTNGDPSADAQAATKYHLPEGNWLSPSDIKAHMFNDHTAVIADLDFFYQAWNHRRSTLPVSSGNWAQGYVLYPNQDDVTASHQHRAGHSILLVGWDDTLEVPVVDKDGNQVLGADGQPVVEKGFYLFKNSWGTSSFGVENPNGSGYGWISQRYVQQYGSIRIAGLPDAPPAVEDCTDGVDNDGNGQIDCDDSACAEAPTCQASGREVTVDGQGGMAIPDADPAGISSPAVVGDADGGTIGSLTVHVHITHTYRGDLVVSLHRGSQAVVLANRTGGSADDLEGDFEVHDFDGADLAGEWRLVVADLAGADVGTLDSWSLTAQVSD